MSPILRSCRSMYVDPGYGALILQAIVAGLAGAMFTARKKLASLVRVLRGKGTDKVE